MNEKTKTDNRQQSEKKSLPPSIILGPIFGSLIGLVGGMLFGNIVWGQIIGFSLGILFGLLWPSLNKGRKNSTTKN